MLLFGYVLIILWAFGMVNRIVYALLVVVVFTVVAAAVAIVAAVVIVDAM